MARGGAIAAAIVTIVIVLMAVGFLLWYLRCRRARKLAASLPEKRISDPTPSSEAHAGLASRGVAMSPEARSVKESQTAPVGRSSDKERLLTSGEHPGTFRGALAKALTGKDRNAGLAAGERTSVTRQSSEVRFRYLHAEHVLWPEQTL
jgi:hypothetical protein